MTAQPSQEAVAKDLLSKIAHFFPDLTWREYEFISEGWDHKVVILDNSVVFRFPTEPDYADALQKEIAVLEHLRPLVDVAIPNYTYVPSGVAFAGYPIVAGKQLSKKAFEALPSVDQSKVVEQLAAFLSAIHSQSIQSGILSTLPREVLAEDQAEVRRAAARHLPAVLSAKDMALTEEILTEIDVLVSQKLPTSFIHNDVYSRHLLWDARLQKLGVIDFSDMSLGDPATDFAELYEYGEAFVQRVYEHYSGPKDDTFLQRAWQYQRWVGVYMLTDHFDTKKTSFSVARETFDRVRKIST
jgi:aminoglycoside phosphotransferase (APT) family kinase protein